MTALAKIIRQVIAEEGPLSLDRYMSLCLGHPQYGYYMTRDPFGQQGDFTTAPEISQVYGELIGVWVVQTWIAMGSPRHFALVELGPGRGTLMADVLRVLSKSEACRKAVEVHLVEISPVLREAQRQRVPGAVWHASVASLPARPSIVIANEFFDALPIRQFLRQGGRVYERCVIVEGDKLALLDRPSPFRIGLSGEGVFEDSRIREAVATQLGDHLRTVGGAALVIDYGHGQTALGDTLQAMRQHQYCRITDVPGEADLTSHVDFEALAKAFAGGGLRINGLMTQGHFLRAMGLEKRVEVLSRSLQGSAQENFIAATGRLANADQMGQHFKVMAASSGKIDLYPFGAT